MRGKEIITKLIIPGAIAMIICLIVHPMCMNGEILDYQIIDREVMIPVGLAKRIEIRSFDQQQNWQYYKSKDYFYKPFKVEFKLLSYGISE